MTAALTDSFNDFSAAYEFKKLNMAVDRQHPIDVHADKVYQRGGAWKPPTPQTTTDFDPCGNQSARNPSERNRLGGFSLRFWTSVHKN